MTLKSAILSACGQTDASVNTDPNFRNVTLLLPSDGTNGAQNNTFIDSSSNNFSITRYGSTTQGSLGPFSRPEGEWSVRFPASSKITIPASTNWQFGTGDFTVECWYMQNSAPSPDGDLITSQNGTFPHNWQLLVNGGSQGNRLCWAWWGVYNSSTSLPLFQNNRWYHLAVSRSGTTTRLFVDGVQGHSFTDTRNYDQIKQLTIGSNNAITTVSNVRIVKGTALYTANFTPSTTPLTAVTNTVFLGCQSRRFIDNSSFNAAHTLTGSCAVSPFNPFPPTATYNSATLGGSGYFNGSGDYLSLPYSSSFNLGTTYTMECWYYPLLTSGFRTVLNIQANNTANFAALIVAVNAGAAYAEVRPSTGGLVESMSGGTVIANAWNHLALSVDAGTARLYLNGTQVATRTLSALTDPQNFVGIGGNGNGYNPTVNVVQGWLGSTRIVKGTAVYTSNFTPPTAPLTNISGTSLLMNFSNAGIFDAAAINNAETVSNAQVSTAQSKWGVSSMLFNGTSDLLHLPDSPMLNLGGGDFTIECWVYPTNTTGNRGIITKRKSDGTETGTWGLRINGGTVYFQDIQTPVDVVSFGTVAANTWTHIAITRQGTTVRGFLNGTLAATGTSSINYTTTRPAFIGMWGTTAGVYPSGTRTEFFAGYIDDLRVTVGVARYTATFTPPTAAFPTR